MNQLALTAFGSEVGFLISEGYPVSYPSNVDNKATCPIPEGWSMNIYFQDFDVEESQFCRSALVIERISISYVV